MKARCPDTYPPRGPCQGLQALRLRARPWAGLLVSLAGFSGSVPGDAHKGRKNEGVIEFVSYSDMKRALEKLDGTEVNGRKIRLVEDKPGSRRRRSYSRSRSHSRYC